MHLLYDNKTQTRTTNWNFKLHYQKLNTLEKFDTCIISNNFNAQLATKETEKQQSK